jgi:hypothetical protein
MSLNPATRTVRIEVLLNEGETANLDALRGGLDRSPFFRNLLYAAKTAAAAARTNGMAKATPRESRGCPGPGRIAGRSRAVSNGRRHL